MGIAAYVIVTTVCDTLLFYIKNRMSWKGYSLKEVNIIWLLFWASWLGAWLVIEDFIENIRLKK